MVRPARLPALATIRFTCMRDRRFPFWLSNVHPCSRFPMSHFSSRVSVVVMGTTRGLLRFVISRNTRCLLKSMFSIFMERVSALLSPHRHIILIIILSRFDTALSSRWFSSSLVRWYLPCLSRGPCFGLMWRMPLYFVAWYSWGFFM